MAHVSELIIYPIKGLSGISLSKTSLSFQGLEHDRTWMLIDDSGMFISQRTQPILSQFRLEPSADGFIIHSPDGLSHRNIPFLHKGIQVSVQVWDDKFLAMHFSDHLDNWFSNILNKSCRLVSIGSNSQRSIVPNKQKLIPLSFADACPILLIGNASLQELNARLAEPIKMDRFRPNIIMDGLDAFAEHELSRFKLGENVFDTIKSCARCSVVTINQQTGEMGIEPLKTLSTFRQKNNKVYFGEYVYCSSGSGIINVGDKLN